MGYYDEGHEEEELQTIPYDEWFTLVSQSLQTSPTPSCPVEYGMDWWVDLYLDGLSPEEALSKVAGSRAFLSQTSPVVSLRGDSQRRGTGDLISDLENLIDSL